MAELRRSRRCDVARSWCEGICRGSKIDLVACSQHEAVGALGGTQRRRHHRRQLLPDDDVSGPVYRQWAEEQGAELVWTVEAKGMSDAMRRMYEYLGRGEYQPPLREDGNPSPEDEDDAYGRS